MQIIGYLQNILLFFMMHDPAVYFLPNIYVADSSISNKGVFTNERIKAGTIIFKYNDITKHNKLLTSEQVYDLAPNEREIFLKYGFQIDENLFAGPLQLLESSDISLYWNHSCSPNTYLPNSNTIAAMRDIEIGEELTFDYGTTESFEWPIGEHNPYAHKCSCGSKECRCIILPTDWMLSEIQKKYDGFFIPYLAKKIQKYNKKID